MRYATLILLGLATVLVYLLSTASADTAFFAQSYPMLLAVNGGFAVVLAGVVVAQLVSLRRQRRTGVFGAKLTWRLVGQFALVAVLPGVVVYAVSVLFLSKSIESWFDVRVEKALEGGLNLGRSVLEAQLAELAKKGEAMALLLSDMPAGEHVKALNGLREQMAVDEVALFDLRGGLIAYAGSDPAQLVPDIPRAAVLQQVRQQQTYTAVDSIEGSRLLLRVVMPVSVLALSEPKRALQLVQEVPQHVARDAETVQAVYREYEELSLSRSGLQYLYALTLTLTLLLALLSALAVAVLLSRRLSSPLAFLQAGTQAVAQGDFSQRAPVESRDELGALINSFNSMTRQLEEARAAAERNRARVETAYAYINGVLANLSAGVMTFDRDFRLVTGNASADAILGLELATLVGQEPSQWRGGAALSAFAAAIRAEFERAGDQRWEVQLPYAAQGAPLTLLVRGTRLERGADSGFVVVFDDVTHLLQAQRDAAWAEVARRLAHEIKNPLTPIQLSAERLHQKLADKLPPPEAEMLARSTGTIVAQVAAMKSMVDAFADYARPRSPEVRRVDLNALAREVLALYESSAIGLSLELSAEPVAVDGDPTLLRQVLHNLLQNAQDALVGAAAPQVVVRTVLEVGWVRLEVQDNGPGFPEALMSRVFEPYVTTKPKGTGLGLAIVKKIVEEHRGVIKVFNSPPQGATVTIRLPRAASSRAGD